MITVYLSYLFFLHLLTSGGYNHMMAAHHINSNKQASANHYAARPSKSEISNQPKPLAHRYSNHLGAIFHHQVSESSIKTDKSTNSENKDNQEKVIKSFCQQVAGIVPHYFHPNNNLIACLKYFAKLYSFYEIIKELLNKYIYHNWIINLLSWP